MSRAPEAAGWPVVPQAEGDAWKPARRSGAPRRVLLCDRHRPFDSSPDVAAQRLAALGRHLRASGLQVDHARLPAAGEDRAGLFRGGLLWRLLDLTATAGAAVDLVIACRAPATLARHPNKVLWLLTDEESGVERPVVELERRGWSDARRVFVTSEARQRHLRRSVGLDTAVLPPPAPDAPAAAWKPVIRALTQTL